MRSRTAVGIAVVGALALAAGLDQRVRDAARGLIPPPTIERPAEKQISGGKSLNERLTRENFAENPYYVDFYPTNTEARRNEDTYTAGQTARFYLRIGTRPSEVRAFVLYEDNMAIRVWNETIPPDGDTSKNVEIRREKGLHTYELRVWDNMGKMDKSHPFRIDYSGKFTDLPPTIEQFQDYHVFSGKDFVAISFYTKDFGDNPGIASAIVYQDGRQIRVLRKIVESDIGNNEVVLRGLKPGRHEFKFRVTDNGSNTIDSEPFDIYESGQYSKPKIERIK